MDATFSYLSNSGDVIPGEFEREKETRSIVPAEGGTVPAEKPRWTMKRLNARHKQALALLSQGISRADTAEAVGYRPEYISWLLRQPAAQAYIQEMNEAANAQLMGMFSQSVDSIGRALREGSIDQKLNAAKLQLRASGKLDPEKEDRRSAEDVVAALLQVNINVSR